MRPHLHTTLIGLILGAGMALTCLSTVVVGMQRPAPATMRTMELPTVVVIARKASQPHTAAQSTTPVAKNG